jgi:hypothetical protein
MAKLTIGVGEDFPVEEKPRAEDRDCSWRGHHDHHHFHHHHGSLRDKLRRYFGRADAAEEKKDKE